MINQPSPILLIVNFSFFCVRFPSDPAHFGLFDWQGLFDWHQSPTSATWYERAVRFLDANLDLPGTIGLDSFWERFQISTKATLYVSEARLSVMNPLIKASRFEEIWNCDTNDCLSSASEWTDGLTRDNWAGSLSDNGADIHQIFPQWIERSHGETGRMRFPKSVHRGFSSCRFKVPLVGSIFVSHSATECPPWCEQKFLSLIRSCPAAEKMIVEPAPALRGWSKERLKKCRVESAKLRGVLNKACKGEN